LLAFIRSFDDPNIGNSSCQYVEPAKKEIIYDVSSGHRPVTGYGQSKWVSEQRLDEFGKRGFIKPCIIRLGMVGPKSTEPSYLNENDWIHILLHACKSTKMFPIYNRQDEDLIPVDIAAETIFNASRLANFEKSKDTGFNWNMFDNHDKTNTCIIQFDWRDFQRKNLTDYKHWVLIGGIFNGII